jgi:epoxyqueuosine reductase
MITAEGVKHLAADEGFELCGVTPAGPPEGIEFFESWIEKGYAGSMGWLAKSVELRSTLESLLPGAKSVIACAAVYNQPNEPVPGQPRIAKYALGRDYHKVLKGRLHRMRRALAEQAQEAEWRVCVDSAPMLEREWAHRAGIGWFGKNTCLINSQRGSWFLLGFLLTTLDLDSDAAAEGGCGTCKACIEACPTGAIIQEDGAWQVDARRCISYLTIEHKGEIDAELQPLMGGWTFGCDVCQEVCPFNSARASQPLRAQGTSEPDFLKTRAWPNLEQLAQISHEDWDVLTQGSPVRRAGWDGIKRNAQINLANR